MIQAGRYKFETSDRRVNRFRERVGFVCGDAMVLPYADNTFDGVTTGFALRMLLISLRHSARSSGAQPEGGWCAWRSRPPPGGDSKSIGGTASR